MNRIPGILAAATLCVCASLLHAQQTEEPLAKATPKPRTAAELAQQTVVVFNESDLESTALAGLYVEKRGIPAKNLIGIRCPKLEEITRKEYDDTIAEPLKKALSERGLWKLHKEPTPAGIVSETKVRYMVLIHGIPLRVAATSAYDGDSTEGTPAEIFTRNECAVDSELSVLGVGTRRISGVLLNPYFRETRAISDTELHSQLLVTRLDAHSPAVVRRMIEDTLAAEAEGLRGFTYIDARGIQGGPLEVGDKWFLNAARDARENGQPVILDNGPALFPDPYPMRHAAIYLGWYAEHVAGPFTREKFKFVPGAVALHLHSFSATSLRDKSQRWCAPMLAAGAAATLGNVYEPFLGLTPQPDIFAQRLREGFTFAEAAYMSQRAVSWMTTFIGDPLYRPFVNLKPDPKNPWDAYRLGVKTWLEKNRTAGEAALRDSAKQLKSGIVSEAMGLLELSGNDHRVALEAFQAARAAYSDPDDRIRVALHEASAVVALKGNAEAARFLKDQASANSTSENTVLLTYLAKTYADAGSGEKKAEPPKKTEPAKKPAAPKTPLNQR